jgi:hypothetical protein
MKTFTGYEYLLIDACNQFGLDKLLFEERILWANKNMAELESLADEADKKPLYLKAVQAIRKAQAGIPTGHLVGFDGVCSGIQIMSVLTGCVTGSASTGMINPEERADAYTATTTEMGEILGGDINVSRKDAKYSLMTSFYGSKLVPTAVFGEGTAELDAFYEAANRVAPGAWEALQDLLATWQPHALVHSWKLPDGFDVRIKVMTKVDKKNPRSRIEIDELEHSTFTYEFKENVGKKHGVSNVANVVHSVDAYVLRSLHRRCNYDGEVMENAALVIETELLARMLGTVRYDQVEPQSNVGYYVQQYERSGMPDGVILSHLTDENIVWLSTAHLKALSRIVNDMLAYAPFEVVTIHDEFKCHANNMNHLRQQYINIMAELADSNLLSDILSQLHGEEATFVKLSCDLSEKIRGSNYALS